MLHKRRLLEGTHTLHTSMNVSGYMSTSNGVESTQRHKSTLTGFFSDWELAAGWELAGDQIGQEILQKTSKKKKLKDVYI